MSVSELARRLRVRVQSVQQWESGQTQPKSARLPDIARALNCTVHFLTADEAEDEPLLTVPPRKIPVVGTAQLGADGFWTEYGHPVGSGDGYLDMPSNDLNAYAVKVVGDSMYPRIRSGEFVLCEPNHTYGPGDEVLVVTTDGRSMVKEFLYQRDGQVVLHSVNDGHGRLTLRQEDVEKIHYVAAIVKAARWRER